MSEIEIVLFVLLLGIIAWLAYNVFLSGARGVSADGYGKMKQRLLKLLQNDGYECEMEEGMVVLHYHHEVFRVHFSDSNLGSRYARVTVVNDYTVEGIDEVHPFVMDALMGRTTSQHTRIYNLSFEDHCACYFGTDVHNIKHFYRGLWSILDTLIAAEGYVRQEFVRYREEFGRKKEPEEEKHIGFKTPTENVSEPEHNVAAETNIKAE